MIKLFRLNYFVVLVPTKEQNLCTSLDVENRDNIIHRFSRFREANVILDYLKPVSAI